MVRRQPELCHQAADAGGAAGSVAAAKRGRPSGHGKIAGVLEAVVARVEASPDVTLAELTDWLAAEHPGRSVIAQKPARRRTA